MKFTIQRNILLFFECVGDKRDFCATCQSRFLCYTGEIVSQEKHLIFGFIGDIEVDIFGERKGFLFYDYDTHDAYHNVASLRNAKMMKPSEV